MPLGVFLALLVVDSLLLDAGILPKDMLGFACEEVGKRISIFKNIGGKVIMAGGVGEGALYQWDTHLY